MITPAFDLSQDPEYLILNIRVPYTRTSEFDLYIDGTDFKFYAKPYFLRWVNLYTSDDAASAKNWICRVIYFDQGVGINLLILIENCGHVSLLFVTETICVNICQSSD